jgi:HK97 family phage portal protein
MGILTKAVAVVRGVFGMTKIDTDGQLEQLRIWDQGYLGPNGERISPPTPELLMKQYEENMWVFNVISSKARAIAGAPWLLKESISGAADKIITDHPFIDLLENPYPDQDLTYQQMIELIGTHLDLSGSAYLEKVYDGSGTIIALAPLLPHKMSKMTTREGKVLFHYSPFPDRVITLTKEQIVHIRYVSPFIEGHGFSPMLPGYITARMDTESSRWNEAYFRKGAQPDVVLKTQKAVPPKERLRIKEEWTARHGGTKNAHSTAVLPYGLDVQVLGTTHRDMQFRDLRKDTREGIHANFHVPPVLSGLLDNMSYATASVQLVVFRDYTMLPLLRSIFAVLTRSVLSEMDPTGKLYLEPDESRMLTQEERSKKLEQTNRAFELGIIGRKEARAEYGYSEEAEQDALDDQPGAAGTETPKTVEGDAVPETTAQAEPGGKPETKQGPPAEVGAAKRFRPGKLRLAK